MNKTKGTFEDLDDRVAEMMSEIKILPNELQKKIKTFEEEYFNAKVRFFIPFFKISYFLTFRAIEKN